jgi:hypothetical protein
MIKVSTFGSVLGKIDLNINLFKLERKMTDIFAQPEQLKAELKEKWLNYYQVNRNWLKHNMDEDSGWCDSVDYEKEELKNFKIDKNYEPRRPECYFILGVISVLEPSVRSLLTFMGSLTTDSEELVKALGLNFDPEIELMKRSQKAGNQQLNLDSQYLDQVREEIQT